MSPDNDETRRQIGKYTILEQIGEGGCGIVYRAIDPELERTVAIKTLTSHESNFRQRFRREAKLVARLDHERIVRVYDAGIEAEEPYLVQEFLDGEDLKQKISRKDALALAVQVEILLETAEGLAHAHDKGIVHRDIKPGNIRVLENGHVKIMDFGIAKQLHDATQQLTQVGFTVGTAAYLSPEQIDGGEIDRRADIFAFGVVAYELLAFERPFPGETISRLFQQITSEKPEPLASRMPPNTPAHLTAMIERCLEKSPGDRPQHMQEVAQDLQRALDELSGVVGSSATAGTKLESVPAASPRGASKPPKQAKPTAREAPTEQFKGATAGHKELPRWFRPVAVASVAIVILAAALVLVQSLPTSEAEQSAGPDDGVAVGAQPAEPTVPFGTPAPQAGTTATPNVAPIGDPAQLILVSNNVQVTEHLVPVLRGIFDSVVVSADATQGRERHPQAGRTLLVEATLSKSSTTSYGAQLPICEVNVSAQLQHAKSFEYINAASAASTEETCAKAIEAAAADLAAKLELR